MGQKKAFEVDSWLARPDPRVAVVLLYGPDRGLVSERAMIFAKGTGLPLDDPFSVVRLDVAEIDRDAGRLLDEAWTIPMFSTRRLLWVRNAGSQKGVADSVKALCADPPREALILIEASDLKKGAALRFAVEQAGCAMALPCYADEEKGIDSVIDEELRKTGMSISFEARQALRRNLGGDRLASRGEVAKLALYAHGQGEISLEDVRSAAGDVSDLSLDDAIDCMLEGRIEDLDTAFTRYTLSGSQSFLLLAAALRQMQTIQFMRAMVESGGGSAASVVASARPPILFWRKKTVERAVALWSVDALARATTRLQAAVLQTRRRPDLALAVTRLALLAIAVESARLSQRTRPQN